VNSISISARNLLQLAVWAFDFRREMALPSAVAQIFARPLLPSLP
jgi:hypothetical protein